MAAGEHFELTAAETPGRGALRGPRGCVAADHPLAVRAGLDVISRGGSAGDAAIAMAAVMVVVQPHYSHLGGDLFSVSFAAGDRGVETIVSSGPSPRSFDVSACLARGTLPRRGSRSVTVPGVVDGWWRLHRSLGRLPWSSLFRDAAVYAREGFPASRRLSAALRWGWDAVEPRDAFREVFAPGLEPGGTVRQPALARTLEDIAGAGPAGFYEGDVARASRERLAEDGVDFSAEEWKGPAREEAPLSVDFAGFRVHTQPPPSHGFLLVHSLALSEAMKQRGPGLPRPVREHRAITLAYAERAKHAGDPDTTGFDPRALLEPAALAGALARTPGTPPPAGGSDTTYLLAIDGDGNAVSLIQSIFAPWGAGVFVPATGVLMNNRLAGFTLDPASPNMAAPGKRPLHTLHSYLVTGPGGALRALGGAPGGYVQPQANLQILDAILAGGVDPQDAVDAPRWCIAGLGPQGNGVHRERRGTDALGEAFRLHGIPVVPFEDREGDPAWEGRMGRAYAAVAEPGGVAVAADPRGEGTAVTF